MRCKQEKRNEKVWILHVIVVNLNLDQYVAKKERENRYSKSYCGQFLFPVASCEMSRYGSLININLFHIPLPAC